MTLTPDLLAFGVVILTALTLALSATFVTVSSAQLSPFAKAAICALVWLVPFIVPLVVLAWLSKRAQQLRSVEEATNWVWTPPSDDEEDRHRD